MGQTFRALRHRNYRLYYTGQAISLSGTWMQTVAQSWLVIELTDSKAALGFVTMLQFLPITLFVLPAGVLADRVSKRNLIMATRLLAMTQSGAADGAGGDGQVECGRCTSWRWCWVWRTASSSRPGRRSSMEMVGKDDLMNAVALNTGLFNGGAA